jgi:PHD/YefM family antitoxin component YafN of YafNO toxin-antitoxin module
MTKAFQTIKIGKKPVVIVPLEYWEKIEEKLEDIEILNSKNLKRKIEKARKERKVYSSKEVKRILGLN